MSKRTSGQVQAGDFSPKDISGELSDDSCSWSGSACLHYVIVVHVHLNPILNDDFHLCLLEYGVQVSLTSLQCRDGAHISKAQIMFIASYDQFFLNACLPDTNTCST